MAARRNQKRFEKPAVKRPDNSSIRGRVTKTEKPKPKVRKKVKMKITVTIPKKK